MSSAPAEISALRAVAGAQRVDEFVDFWSTGTLAQGLFSCVACGQTVVSTYQLPPCPRCEGRLWEDPSTNPFEPGAAVTAPSFDYDEWTTRELESTAGLLRGTMIALVGGPLLWLFLAGSAYTLLR